MTRKDLEKQGYKATPKFYCEQHAEAFTWRLLEEGKEVKITQKGGKDERVTLC